MAFALRDGVVEQVRDLLNSAAPALRNGFGCHLSGAVNFYFCISHPQDLRNGDHSFTARVELPSDASQAFRSSVSLSTLRSRGNGPNEFLQEPQAHRYITATTSDPPQERDGVDKHGADLQSILRNQYTLAAFIRHHCESSSGASETAGRGVEEMRAEVSHLGGAVGQLQSATARIEQALSQASIVLAGQSANQHSLIMQQLTGRWKVEQTFRQSSVHFHSAAKRDRESFEQSVKEHMAQQQRALAKLESDVKRLTNAATADTRAVGADAASNTPQGNVGRPVVSRPFVFQHQSNNAAGLQTTPTTKSASASLPTPGTDRPNPGGPAPSGHLAFMTYAAAPTPWPGTNDSRSKAIAPPLASPTMMNQHQRPTAEVYPVPNSPGRPRQQAGRTIDPLGQVAAASSAPGVTSMPAATGAVATVPKTANAPVTSSPASSGMPARTSDEPPPTRVQIDLTNEPDGPSGARLRQLSSISYSPEPPTRHVQVHQATVASESLHNTLYADNSHARKGHAPLPKTPNILPKPPHLPAGEARSPPQTMGTRPGPEEEEELTRWQWRFGHQPQNVLPSQHTPPPPQQKSLAQQSMPGLPSMSVQQATSVQQGAKTRQAPPITFPPTPTQPQRPRAASPQPQQQLAANAVPQPTTQTTPQEREDERRRRLLEAAWRPYRGVQRESGRTTQQNPMPGHAVPDQRNPFLKGGQPPAQYVPPAAHTPLATHNQPAGPTLPGQKNKPHKHALHPQLSDYFKRIPPPAQDRLPAKAAVPVQQNSPIGQTPPPIRDDQSTAHAPLPQQSPPTAQSPQIQQRPPSSHAPPLQRPPSTDRDARSQPGSARRPLQWNRGVIPDTEDETSADSGEGRSQASAAGAMATPAASPSPSWPDTSPHEDAGEVFWTKTRNPAPSDGEPEWEREPDGDWRTEPGASEMTASPTPSARGGMEESEVSEFLPETGTADSATSAASTGAPSPAYSTAESNPSLYEDAPDSHRNDSRRLATAAERGARGEIAEPVAGGGSISQAETTASPTPPPRPARSPGERGAEASEADEVDEADEADDEDETESAATNAATTTAGTTPAPGGEPWFLKRRRDEGDLDNEEVVYIRALNMMDEGGPGRGRRRKRIKAELGEGAWEVER